MHKRVVSASTYKRERGVMLATPAQAHDMTRIL